MPGNPDAEVEDGRVDRTLGPPAPSSEWPKGPAAPPERGGGPCAVGAGSFLPRDPGWLAEGENRGDPGESQVPGPERLLRHP